MVWRIDTPRPCVDSGFVVFIRKVPGRPGATKVQIAQRRDGRDVVLEHIGTARSEADLAALMAIAKTRLHPGQQELNLGLDNAPPSGMAPSGVITSKRCALLWHVLTCCYARLGFDAVGDDAFRDLVLARLIEPTSKAEAVRVLDEIGVEHASLRTMFRSLQRCQQADYRARIASACFERATHAGDLSLLLFDVTTLYFETENEDTAYGPNKGLRRVGYSKERRVDPQIVVGMLTDRSGFPLEVTCWEGNKAEQQTILPTIKAFQEKHGAGDMVIVADAGMLSAVNLKALDEAGLFFIVGSRLTKAPADLEAHFHWNGPNFMDGQVIDTITPRHAAAKDAQSSIAKRAEPVWDPAVHTKSWRAIWAYSTKRAKRDVKTLRAQEERARDVIEGVRAARKPRFVKTTNGTATLDTKALERAKRLAGLKGYVTNLPARMMLAHEVISSYHDLWRIEQSFRMSKSDLRARPIFHHDREAIEAHLTIVMAALAIARYLQEHTGLSLKKTIRPLRHHQQITVRIAGHEHTAADPLTPQLTQILTDLNISPN